MPISVKGRDGGREKSQGGWEKRKRGIRLITNGKMLQSLPDSSPLGHGSIGSSQLRRQSICRGIPKASIDLQGERQWRQSICRVRRRHSIWGVAQAKREAWRRQGGAAALLLRERNGKMSGGGDVAQGHEDSMLRRCVEFRSDGDE